MARYRRNSAHYPIIDLNSQHASATYGNQPGADNDDIARYFDRVGGSVNLRLLRQRRVVVVGIGTVGSKVAGDLARSGVGELRLIDHDPLEMENLFRHELPREYLGNNKARGLAEYLRHEIPGVRTESQPYKIDESIPDGLLDYWLSDAHLIVVATDDRSAQRRIGERALALDIPAIFPALYAEGGGEVMIQLGPRFPCFGCWDLFRSEDQRLRGVSALSVAAAPIISQTVNLCLDVLDSRSRYQRKLAPTGDGIINQLFVVDRHEESVRSAPISRRSQCPACAVGPSPLLDNISGRPWPEAGRSQTSYSSHRATSAPAVEALWTCLEGALTLPVLIFFAALALAPLVGLAFLIELAN